MSQNNTINNDTVKHMAKLSSLAITDNQVASIKLKMNHILEMIQTIDHVDTSGISPLAHPYKISQRLREDKVTETNQRDTLSKLTSFYESGYYLVPKVID
jgi:aspartyl-tRNA(Asn)/glutamyl-tRNA(Gln) amidotransferase subunit C